ncbi:hypothetical protein ID866_6101 [Astraeus odoratus]|nr:hypothetical protein ID866_6101 [Astraeus odoratus]
MRNLLPVLLVAGQALAQVPLPQPPFMPQNASAGAISSSGGIPNPQWSSLLGNLLYFYEAQRSGKLPSTKRVQWRNDSALTDGQDVKLDLTGGYYDAGDYIKCTFPLVGIHISYSFPTLMPAQSATVMSICWGATDFGKGYDLANQTPYLDDMLRWSLDWLIKVAETNLTNAYWGGDQNIPEPRISYQINGTSASKVMYQDSVPDAGIAYASSGYGDELAIAALFLSLALNSTSMYQQAETYYSEYNLGGYQGVFNWDTKTPGLPVLFAQITQANPSLGNYSNWQAAAESYFDGIVYGSSGPSYSTGGGLLYYPGDSDEASLNPALNAAMLLNRYVPLASTQKRKQDYYNYAKNQVDYALGKNPMSMPYIVGANPNSPQNPHSALASGGNNISDINNSPPVEAYVLYGAVVGGPDKYDRFFDIRADWPETEPALDYNAPMLTLAALHVLNDTSDPFYTSLQAGIYKTPAGMPCDAAYTEGCGGPQLSQGGQIALGAIIGLAGAVISGLVGWWGWLSWRGNYDPCY